MAQLTIEQAIDLANQQRAAGNLAAAVELYRQILAIDPARPVYNSLGHALLSLGQLDAAIEVFHRAMELFPRDFIAHSNLGSAYQMAGRAAEALAAQRRAVALKPDDAHSLCNLAIALRGTGALSEAIETARRAVAIAPRFSGALQVLGDLLVAAREFREAEKVVQRGIEIDPREALNYNNLGVLYQHMGRLDDAVASLKKAIALQPGLSQAQANLANALRELGDADEAIQHLRRAVELSPGDAGTHSALLLALQYRSTNPKELLKEHRKWEEQHAPKFAAMRQVHRNMRDPDRRLRVGYVSADFREHPIFYFLEPLIAAHDRGEVEVFCYSDVTRPDDRTKRIRQRADCWRDVSVTANAALIEQIRSDHIDILVDLAVHSGGNRLQAMAAKPAPVQVSYLGYAASTGLSYIDYRITDAIIDPPGEMEGFGTEKLIRLSGGFCAYRPPENCPDIRPKHWNGIRFGSFNSLAKASDELLDAWCEILRAAPESTLTIQARGADQGSVRERYRKIFESREVSMDRVEMNGAQPLDEYFRILAETDIALDTFGFNGHTTSCHALWMGVPVVTRSGALPLSRVGLSLLSCMGLEELATTSPEEYVRVAVELAKDRDRLAAMRESLRERMKRSPLLDGKRLARQVEAAYRDAWRKWCQGAGA